MSQHEEWQVLKGFNQTGAEYPREALIHELFEQQVERTPDAVAVQYEGEQLSYAELNAKANQLAHRLRALRDEAGNPVVGPDERVAICVERSLEMVVGLLGILKAGAAYVPVDPEYPQDRIAYVLQDAGARIVLTQRHLQTLLQGTGTVPEGDGDNGCARILLLDDEGVYAEQPTENIGKDETGQSSRHLAYVIYTSGSTGLPKGVMNEHRGVINRLWWMQREYQTRSTDRILQKTPFSFDVSVWEFFWTLLNGARLIMARPGGHQDPAYLEQAIEENSVTTLHFVPSMLRAFVDHLKEPGCLDLRQIVCSGEELPITLQRRCQEKLPNSVLNNLYGPTEAAVDVTYWQCDPNQTEGQVPIGRPISNTQIYILDAQGQPVPIGVSGEIHIAGDGVARGYLNRPELTAERFVRDPFSDDPDARMYRTGDLGRWRADGAIEYLGRNDFQVKIRGFRIELGEIEARLAELPAVREVVVVAREAGQNGEGAFGASGETGTTGDKRLVAYWVAREEVSEADVPTVEALREHLRAGLPAYMMPSAFVKLDAMPLTPNGKVDRKALPAPDADALVTHVYEAPQGPVEEALAGIWQELLGVEKVGRHDNFFDLGGHSLLIVSLVEKLRQQGLKAEIRDVFAAHSLMGLAEVLQRVEGTQWSTPANLIPEGCTAITPDMLPLVQLTQTEIDTISAQVPGGAANIQDIYPLAPLQQGILFHHRLNPEKDVYVMSSLMSFDSWNRFNEFVLALQWVIQRHDVLRTAILWDNISQAVQVVCRYVKLEVEEFERDSREGQTDLEQMKAYLEKATLHINLQHAPMARLIVSRKKDEKGYYALLLIHHIVDDVTSLKIISHEVAQMLTGNDYRLSTPIQYREFIAHLQRNTSEEIAKSYFIKFLGDMDEPTAPFGLLDVHGDGQGVQEARLALEDALAVRIREMARGLNMSPAVLFHIAYGLVMARCSDRDDVVFGSVFSGRMGSVTGADRMLGMFINTLPVRLRLAGQSVGEAVRATRQTLAELLEYEQTPLTVAQRCSGMRGNIPLFSAMLNYRHTAEEIANDTALDTGIEVISAQERTNYPLAVSVDDLGEGFAITAQIKLQTQDDASRVARYLAHAVEQVVNALKQTPEQALLALTILPQEELDQVLRGFNQTEAEYPREALIHELFEQQVERTPDAVAVQYEDEQLTYSGLNARANQLAHRLRALRDEAGNPVVGPDERVAICVERSLEMVVGLLGILKAGAAYVPVDPEYPQDRIAYVLRDAGARIVLTQRRLLALLQGTGTVPEGGGDNGYAQTLLLLDDEGVYASLPTTNITKAETGQTSRHLAYVIYTSGSTGQPKGVMNEHRGVVNRLLWMQQEYGLTPHDRVLQKTAFSFDVSVWEFFWTLQTGAILVMARPGGHQNPHYLIETIGQAGITTLHFVPSMLQIFADAASKESLHDVHRIMCSGEELPSACCANVQASGLR